LPAYITVHGIQKIADFGVFPHKRALNFRQSQYAGIYVDKKGCKRVPPAGAPNTDSGRQKPQTQKSLVAFGTAFSEFFQICGA
jgi:hypothetical protein